MSALRVCMFGRFEVSAGADRSVLEGRRQRELLAFLLLHRGHPWPREMLVDSIWGEGESEQLHKALRQSLWKLQSGVDLHNGALLAVDAEFVVVSPKCQLWLDIAEFEAAHAAAKGRPGVALDDATAERLQAASALYRGDLLEGWYVDWCMSERERLLGLHIEILNKLSAWCAARGRYADGLAYCYAALQHDSAHERSHRHMMRLHHLAGDRCAAIRQYQHCVQVMRDEMDVPPDARTVDLYAQIVSDALGRTASEFDEAPAADRDTQAADLAAEVLRLKARLSAIEGRVGLV